MRTTLFREAAREASRERALAKAAQHLRMDPDQVLARLFSDLPGERPLAPLTHTPSPTELALRTNLSIVQGIVASASSVVVKIWGNARDLVRYARLRGLICTVGRCDDGALLELSGPYALFRRTRVYGAALASMIPRLPWCTRFEMRARCHIEEETATLIVRPADPIFPAKEPRRFDSKVEQRFAREFARRAPDWDLVREPRPIPVGRTLIFPDFELVHRHDPKQRWLVEIVGYWMPEYIQGKIDALKMARCERLIVCIDAERNCSAEDFPTASHVLQYRRHVDVEQLLRIVEDRRSRG